MKTLKEKIKVLKSRGATEIRPGVWTSPGIFSNPEMTKLYEFETDRLYFYTRKEALGWAIHHASRRGQSVLAYKGMYMKVHRYPEIIRLKNERDDVIDELEAEMKKIWPLGSTIKFMRMSNQKNPSVGKVSAYDGVRTRIFVKCEFFKAKWIVIGDIVEE